MGYRPIPTTALHDYDMASNPRKIKDTYLTIPAKIFIERYLAEHSNDCREELHVSFATWFRKREQEREEARELYR